MLEKFKPKIYANHDLNVPSLNWDASISVDWFDFNDTKPYKVFWALEPEDIGHIEEKLIKNHGFYDLILTFNHTVLSACSNAVLFPVTGVWTEIGKNEKPQKDFAVSFLTSSKVMCYGHEYRVGVFKWIEAALSEGKRISPAPITLHMSPPHLPDKRHMLVPFQYAISMQNSQQRNYFSEILLDCFATKTIPIFWGCVNIGEFFNTDGIIQFGETLGPDGSVTVRPLPEVLASLDPTHYYDPKVQAAIEDNYDRAMKYKDRIGLLIKAITDAWTPKFAISPGCPLSANHDKGPCQYCGAVPDVKP